MDLTELPAADVVLAARGGDRPALEALVAGYLPLVYTVVGRATERDLEVDDVVQDTMLRMLDGLPELRRPESLRPWVISIALSRLAEARRQAGRRRGRQSPIAPERLDPVDPASDFVGLSILQDALTREQREVAEATRWLDPDFRDLLSLWWLEQAGRLDRADLAEALNTSPAHVAVRVQRMRAQLDTARSVVRAVAAVPGCADLARVERGWDGQPGPLWRKRLARHVRGCPDCGPLSTRLVPPERLLAGFGLLALPAGLAARGSHSALTGFTAAPGTATGGGAVVGSHAGFASSLIGAKAAGALVATVLLAGGAVSYAHHRPDPAPGARAVTVTVQTTAMPTPPSSAAPTTRAAPTAIPSRPVGPKSSVGGTVSPAVAPFSTTVPAGPDVRSATELGPIRQNKRVAGRDNGQSTGYAGRSVWIFDDTTLKNPWGFLSNSGAVTTDLRAADGISLASGNPVTVNSGQTPVPLLPLTGAEKAFEKAHNSPGCTAASDRYCGARFAFWPGPVVADPKHGRVLVFYGKLCRGAAADQPCSGPLGQGLGTGIAAIDMQTGTVSRLKATGRGPISSVEGADPTLFFPDSGGFSSAALVVGGELYAYGDCSYGCKLGRVPLAALTDRSRWRFFASGHWQVDAESAAHVIDPGSAGQSVFYDAALKAYLNVYLPYGSNTVKYQVGGSPFGPWSGGRTAFTTAGGGAVNYALFAHPEYAEKNGLVQYLSYFHPATGAQQLVRLEFARP